MKTIAFVGPSGTGKSYRSMVVAKKYGADCVIDDGLLIKGSKVIAGTSAKKESTRVASVKHALFLKDALANEVKSAIKKYRPACIMILGTSDEMVKKIAARLELPAIERIIYINEVSTQEEMSLAHKMRMEEGKHVIPVPTFEIKQDFSGYFLHPLKIFKKRIDRNTEPEGIDKSIIRPTFSYMGDYEISDNVLTAITRYETEKIKGVYKLNSVIVRKTDHGVHLDLSITVIYHTNIPEVCSRIRKAVGYHIEKYTSVNTRRIHIYVKGIVKA